MTGMSRSVMALIRALPMPGYPKRYSTATMPPASQASCRAVPWVAGTMAFGMACRQMTMRSGRPLRRAIEMYSLSRISMVEARIIREM